MELSAHPTRGTALEMMNSWRTKNALNDWQAFLINNPPTSELPQFIQNKLPELINVEACERMSNDDLFACCFTLLLLEVTGYRRKFVAGSAAPPLITLV